MIALTEYPDFLILSETHLTKNIEEKEISLHGYDNICSLSTSSRTGGVILYFKRHWNVTKAIEKNYDLKYWMLFCNATYDKYDIIIGAIYRSPSYSESEFCDIFEQTIEEICDNDCDILIAGDFNIDWKKTPYIEIELEV